MNDPRTLRNLSDEELWLMIVNQERGWQEAFKELFIERHGHIVLPIAMWFDPRTLGLDVPEDLFGDLVEHLAGPDRTWSRLGSWDPQKGPFDTWLRKVVWNLCFKRAKREGRWRKRHLSLDDLIPTGEEVRGQNVISDSESLPIDELVARKVLLEQAWEQLKPQEQWIIFLSFFLELTDGEIGDILNMRRETVNRKKSEAIRKMKKYINGDLTGETN